MWRATLHTLPLNKGSSKFDEELEKEISKYFHRSIERCGFADGIGVLVNFDETLDGFPHWCEDPSCARSIIKKDSVWGVFVSTVIESAKRGNNYDC